MRSPHHGGDDDLQELLPSRNHPRLARAIGRRLEEVERVFTLDLDAFVDGGREDPADFFRRNVGPTQFRFDGGVQLTFTGWAEQLSVVLAPGLIEPDFGQRLHRLTESLDPLRTLIGQTCHDVRVWTYAEDFEADEARECAVSFVLDGAELFYCTWLHGDMDADYVLPRELVPLNRAESATSVSTGRAIVDHPASMARRINGAAERFHSDERRQASHAALLKEYLRRMALWAQALGLREEWPWFDVAAELFPARFAESDDLRLHRFGGAFESALKAAVNFAEVAGTAEVRGFGLPDPYAPVVRLLERGATLTTEHGMIFAGTAGMSRQPFPATVDDWTSIALDDDTLDAFDGLDTPVEQPYSP